MGFHYDLHWRFAVSMTSLPPSADWQVPHPLGSSLGGILLDYRGHFIPSKASVIAALSGSSNPSKGCLCPSKRLSIQENKLGCQSQRPQVSSSCFMQHLLRYQS